MRNVFYHLVFRQHSFQHSRSLHSHAPPCSISLNVTVVGRVALYPLFIFLYFPHNLCMLFSAVIVVVDKILFVAKSSHSDRKDTRIDTRWKPTHAFMDVECARFRFIIIERNNKIENRQRCCMFYVPAKDSSGMIHLPRYYIPFPIHVENGCCRFASYCPE